MYFAVQKSSLKDIWIFRYSNQNIITLVTRSVLDLASSAARHFSHSI
jgi:hypothetical protein